MAIAQDTGSPWATAAITGTTKVCTVTTAGTNRLLVALCAPGLGTLTSVAGGGLTWNQLYKVGGVGVFWAWAATAITSQAITATFSAAGGSLTVFAVSGAKNVAPNFSVQSIGVGGAGAANFTFLGTGSLGCSVISDISDALSLTAAAGNTLDTGSDFSDGTNLFCGASFRTTSLSGPGSVSMGASGTITNGGTLVGVEVFDAAYVPAFFRGSMMMGVGL